MFGLKINNEKQETTFSTYNEAFDFIIGKVKENNNYEAIGLEKEDIRIYHTSKLNADGFYPHNDFEFIYGDDYIEIENTEYKLLKTA